MIETPGASLTHQPMEISPKAQKPTESLPTHQESAELPVTNQESVEDILAPQEQSENPVSIPGLNEEAPILEDSVAADASQKPAEEPSPEKTPNDSVGTPLNRSQSPQHGEFKPSFLSNVGSQQQLDTAVAQAIVPDSPQSEPTVDETIKVTIDPAAEQNQQEVLVEDGAALNSHLEENDSIMHDVEQQAQNQAEIGEIEAKSDVANEPAHEAINGIGEEALNQPNNESIDSPIAEAEEPEENQRTVDDPHQQAAQQENDAADDIELDLQSNGKEADADDSRHVQDSMQGDSLGVSLQEAPQSNGPANGNGTMFRGKIVVDDVDEDTPRSTTAQDREAAMILEGLSSLTKSWTTSRLETEDTRSASESNHSDFEEELPRDQRSPKSHSRVTRASIAKANQKPSSPTTRLQARKSLSKVVSSPSSQRRSRVKEPESPAAQMSNLGKSRSSLRSSKQLSSVLKPKANAQSSPSLPRPSTSARFPTMSIERSTRSARKSGLGSEQGATQTLKPVRASRSNSRHLADAATHSQAAQQAESILSPARSKSITHPELSQKSDPGSLTETSNEEEDLDHTAGPSLDATTPIKSCNPLLRLSTPAKEQCQTVQSDAKSVLAERPDDNDMSALRQILSSAPDHDDSAQPLPSQVQGTRTRAAKSMNHILASASPLRAVKTEIPPKSTIKKQPHKHSTARKSSSQSLPNGLPIAPGSGPPARLKKKRNQVVRASESQQEASGSVDRNGGPSLQNLHDEPGNSPHIDSELQQEVLATLAHKAEPPLTKQTPQEYPEAKAPLNGDAVEEQLAPVASQRNHLANESSPDRNPIKDPEIQVDESQRIPDVDSNDPVDELANPDAQDAEIAQAPDTENGDAQQGLKEEPALQSEPGEQRSKSAHSSEHEPRSDTDQKDEKLVNDKDSARFRSSQFRAQQEAISPAIRPNRKAKWPKTRSKLLAEGPNDNHKTPNNSRKRSAQSQPKSNKRLKADPDEDPSEDPPPKSSGEYEPPSASRRTSNRKTAGMKTEWWKGGS